MTVSAAFVRHAAERALMEGDVQDDGILYSITMDSAEDAELMTNTTAAFKEEGLDVEAEADGAVVTFKFPRNLFTKLLGA